MSTIPEFDVDIFSDEVLHDPYPTYAQMRELGPVIRLTTYGVLAVTRYADVRTVLMDPQRFISGKGVGFNDEFNEVRKHSVIASDSPRHEQLRGVLQDRLGPRSIRSVEHIIRPRAQELVGQMIDSGSFDAVTDFGQVFPVEIVGELIGLPVDARAELLRWANGAFNAFGPPGERTSAGLADIAEQFEYIRTVATREKLAPGSMGAAVYEAADAGIIPPEYCLHLLSAYLTAGMDTTVNALGAMVWLLGSNPDQWQELRQLPHRAGAVVNEVLRIESPAQMFSRIAAVDVEVGGVEIAAGERVAVIYASANRDERQYPNPDRFDIHRNSAGHLAFGTGVHACAGQVLARIELQAVLESMIEEVGTISVGEPIRKLNNVLRGFASVPAVFTPAPVESRVPSGEPV
ncbi:cytochrome P450 [Mycolicibacterium frederiksbergense]|uniref:Cytochrome P450 n=1 Tax=Mycolicibacterium frederiksbergense TaxID=117567 RepID=A0A6H0RZU6_9MYCO|nr:cytochrome P450 [Mycolicibacterium frederiksbergense]QIV79981.1 cytochrome P450 [Mycolicibacterium frederiksbergense]